MNVVVVGGGLAGSVAALSARSHGAAVTQVTGPPGASAMWSGVAEVFGPAYDAVDYATRLGTPHLETVGRPPLESVDARFQRLIRRRSYHPYTRLGLDVAELQTLLSAAGNLLGSCVVWSQSPTYVTNDQGTVRLADGAAQSVHAGRLDLNHTLVVVGFEHYPGFSAEAVAAQLAHQGVPAETHWTTIPDVAPTHSPAVAAAGFERLDDGAIRELARGIATRVADGVAILPPILGRTQETHRRLIDGLQAEGARVAEAAGVRQSVHGLRLHGVLADAVRAAGCTTLRARAVRALISGQRITGFELEGGEKVTADRVVLASGRAVGGGIERQAPFAESLLELPIFLDGTALEPTAVEPGNLTTGRWLDDQPLFRVGIAIDHELRPLDVSAEPRFDNLFAAGLVLGGMDFARDGSAFGASLVSGLLAGRHAAKGVA